MGEDQKVKTLGALVEKGWMTIYVVHVVPQNDLAEHALCETCWCNPREEQCDYGTPKAKTLVIHHAADQREDAEA